MKLKLKQKKVSGMTAPIDATKLIKYVSTE
jgi:hypothetical protein